MGGGGTATGLGEEDRLNSEKLSRSVATLGLLAT